MCISAWDVRQCVGCVASSSPIQALFRLYEGSIKGEEALFKGEEARTAVPCVLPHVSRMYLEGDVRQNLQGAASTQALHTRHALTHTRYMPRTHAHLRVLLSVLRILLR